MSFSGDPREAARLARERLEILKLFGWSVPLRRRQLRPSPVARTPSPPRQAPGAAVPASVGASAAAAPEPTAQPQGPPPAAVPGATVSPGEGAQGAPLAARASALEDLRRGVAACTLCSLCRERTQTVFGVGDPGARLLFVGEAPGAEEDRLGEPFVGAAGPLLDDIIRAMGLERPRVYIANVVKCRPPNNRQPNPDEIGFCRAYLERQIELIAPEVIVTLGAVSTRTLLGTEDAMSKLRGQFHDYRGFPVMPTYHPAYLLRNPSEKRKVWEDVQLVMRRLGLAPRQRSGEGGSR